MMKLDRKNGYPAKTLFILPKRFTKTFARPNVHRWFCVGLLFLGTAGCTSHSTSQWQLVWQDEFNGNQVDPARWEFEVNANGGGNNELQYYVTNNARVQDGLLFIEARKENYTGPEVSREFTSSRIRTKDHGDWKYGRFEIRAKLPTGQGYWPAIWMLPTDNVYGGWPHSGEIDIMEVVGHKPNNLHGTLHYADLKGNHTYRGTNTALAAGTFADTFHVFSLEWDPSTIRWYLDNQLYQTQTNWTSGTNLFPAPFDQRFHLILNLAIGGNWPGNPDTNTVFPQAMVVDYVRVYQKK
ncbi:MAG: glycoside hydrolase family 16 protein [Verrucomicrobiales bacterium]|nr:glycoside hydrolase family 16 protein [Verrucomicrobiales bacterium]